MMRIVFVVSCWSAMMLLLLLDELLGHEAPAQPITIQIFELASLLFFMVIRCIVALHMVLSLSDMTEF